MAITKKHLSPASCCGHIHYLRREVLEALGVDLDVADAERDAGVEAIDLSKYWATSDEFRTGVIADANEIINAHAALQQNVEGISRQMRYLALERCVERAEAGADPQLARILRVLMLDAKLDEVNEERRQSKLSQVLGGLLGPDVEIVELNADQLPPEPDVPTGRKH